MTKKEKDLLVEQFNARMAKVVVFVNDGNIHIPIDEYMEQEQYRKHQTTSDLGIGVDKQYIAPDENLGILSEDEILKTDYYLIKLGL